MESRTTQLAVTILVVISGSINNTNAADAMRAYDLPPSSDLFFSGVPWEVSELTDVTPIFREHCPDYFTSGMVAEYYTGQFFIKGPVHDVEEFDRYFALRGEAFRPIPKYQVSIRILEIDINRHTRVTNDFVCFPVISGGFVEYESTDNDPERNHAIVSLFFGLTSDMDERVIQSRVECSFKSNGLRKHGLSHITIPLGKEVTLLEWGGEQTNTSRYMLTVECIGQPGKDVIPNNGMESTDAPPAGETPERHADGSDST